MNDIDGLNWESTQKRQQIEQLNRLGDDCWHEEFVKAEKFYQRAVELAESLNDLSLLMQERFLLANMQRMQGKYKLALSGYTWLIEVAYDPQKSHQLTENDLWCVARSFMDILGMALSLPDMKAADRERMCDRALDWMASIGKRDWSGGIRYQRGCIWHNQERYEKALPELEAALALKRRYPNAPGYYLSTHLLSLGDLSLDMRKLDEAEKYYQEVVEGYGLSEGFSKYGKHWALTGLANVALKREDFIQAEIYGRKSLELARVIESPWPSYASYKLLGNIFWKQKQIEVAIEARIQAWHYARKYGLEKTIYEIYREMAEVRIHQAKTEPQKRYIRQARQWLQWALPIAERLDQQVGLTTRQENLRAMKAECDKLAYST
jgi:tetratricopeptide (TPR) repeat protein